MRFTIILPSIFDVYVTATKLNILQEKLEKIGPKGLTTEIQSEVNQTAAEYILAVNAAEKLYGSTANIQAQIDVLKSSRIGIT